MQFRGFRQFGVIGGLGMLLAWGATFVLMPPLIAWLDRGRLRARAAAAGTPRGPMARARARRRRRTRAPFARRRAVLLTLAPVWEVARFGRDQLEYDFSHLRRRDTWTRARATGAGRWTRCSAAT